MKNIFVTALLVIGMAAFAQEATDAFGPVEKGQCRIVIFGSPALMVKPLFKVKIDNDANYEFLTNTSYLVINASAGRHTIDVAYTAPVINDELRDGLSLFLKKGETAIMEFTYSDTGLKCTFQEQEQALLKADKKTPITVSLTEGQ